MARHCSKRDKGGAEFEAAFADKPPVPVAVKIKEALGQSR